MDSPGPISCSICVYMCVCVSTMRRCPPVLITTPSPVPAAYSHGRSARSRWLNEQETNILKYFKVRALSSAGCTDLTHFLHSRRRAHHMPGAMTLLPRLYYSVFASPGVPFSVASFSYHSSADFVYLRVVVFAFATTRIGGFGCQIGGLSENGSM